MESEESGVEARSARRDVARLISGRIKKEGEERERKKSWRCAWSKLRGEIARLGQEMRTTACFHRRRTSRIVRKEKIQADAAMAHSEILSAVINCDTRTVRLLPKYATLQT